MTIEGPTNQKKAPGSIYSKCPVSVPYPSSGIARLATLRLDGCIRFHRAHFLDVLVAHLNPGVAHFGKRLTSYHHEFPRAEDGPLTLHFEDGSRAACDLLVGCDGIRSTVRGQMLHDLARTRGDPALLELVETVWTGTIAYRGLVPVERLKRPDGTVHRTVESPMMVRNKYGSGSKHCA